jgi:hypothetical protein
MSIIQVNPCILTEAFYPGARCIGGNRWWRPERIRATDEEIALVLITDRLDRSLIVALRGESVTNELAERRVMKRREYRPLIGRRSEHSLIDPKRMDDRCGNGCLIPLLFFPEDGQRLRVEIDITPPETLAALVVGNTEDFGTTDGSIGEEGDERAVTTRSNRSVDTPVLVVFVLAAGVDRGVSVLIDIACDPVTVFGTPGLLITGAPPIVVG